MLKLLENGINFDETTQKLWENRLIDSEKWILDAIQGHTNHCWLEFCNEWIPRLQNDPHIQSIPTSREDFVRMVTERPDYMNRKQKEDNRNKQDHLKQFSQFTVE